MLAVCMDSYDKGLVFSLSRARLESLEIVCLRLRKFNSNKYIGNIKTRSWLRVPTGSWGFQGQIAQLLSRASV
jgi:hypothetical protein